MASRAVQEVLAVWKRQKQNWRIVVTRTVFNRFFGQLTMEYASIYVRELGATPVQLGSVNSVAGLGSTLIATPAGWLHDRYSLRKLFTMGVGLVAIASLVYALARDWVMIVPAIFLAQLAMRFHCFTICDVSLKNEDRATGKALCEGLGSIPSLAAPILAAFLITFFGGISAEGIRPLYWIQFVAGCAMFLYIAIRLTEIERVKVDRKTSGFLGDFREVFERGTAVKRWIAFRALDMFTLSLTMAFRYPFAHEIKGAEQFIIGWMATAALILQIIFATPLGRLADRVGRKKVFYLLTPLVCASYLLLIVAPTPPILILSAALLGFHTIGRMVIQGAMTPELVPSDCVGRWRGLIGLFEGLASIVAPFIGGIVWEALGPAYVFIIPILLELLVRVPIMATVAETLRARRQN